MRKTEGGTWIVENPSEEIAIKLFRGDWIVEESDPLTVDSVVGGIVASGAWSCRVLDPGATDQYGDDFSEFGRTVDLYGSVEIPNGPGVEEQLRKDCKAISCGEFEGIHPGWVFTLDIPLHWEI